ncbi:MAG TPA: hypothetical protein ACN46X_04570, partial [Prochlorococcus sp.]
PNQAAPVMFWNLFKGMVPPGDEVGHFMPASGKDCNDHNQRLQRMGVGVFFGVDRLSSPYFSLNFV